MRKEVEHLSDRQLDTAYRTGGWTIRQVVHHCADSHMNSYIRFRLALTEEVPTIKPYREELWAELADARKMPIEPSLMILQGVHARWVVMLRSLSSDQWPRLWFHPDDMKEFSLLQGLQLYVWHGKHHLAHIQNLKKTESWD
jgi:hypothetical protein